MKSQSLRFPAADAGRADRSSIEPIPSPFGNRAEFFYVLSLALRLKLGTSSNAK